MSTAAAVVGVGKAGYDIYEGAKQSKELSKGREDYQAKAEDSSLRQEATYRQDRGMLQSAIGDYYKKQGWALPAASAPGAGTGRALPGEAPLYPGYDVPIPSTAYAGQGPQAAVKPQELPADGAVPVSATPAAPGSTGAVTERPVVVPVQGQVAPQIAIQKLAPDTEVNQITRTLGARYGY